MIADVFIKRPVTAIVVSVVITLVGILSLMNLPVSQYPDITPPIVQVTGNFVGADAQTVERTVATPIESQVNGSPGMSFLQTNSTSDGTMTMNVTFDVGTNIDIATLDVQNRVSVATPQLPDDVKRTGLTVKKRNPSILMLVAMYSPKGTHDIKFMDNYTNVYIKDALLRVKGVGDIFTRADNFSMRIWLNPDKMAQMGMTANDVVTKLQSQNIQVAAGSVGSTPQTGDQSFEYSLQVNGQLSSVQDFENIVVRTKPDERSIVYLKDIARVELGKFNYASNNFVDGQPSSYLLVYQAPGSNALETAEGVYKAMDDMKKTFPADVDYKVPFEAVSVVSVSIQEVVKTLIEALVLVVIVVFLFLQSWRATLIPILAIPVAIIGTFIFFIPLGFTVNTLTLFGFVLAIGIVVDDAIVVVEATQHYIDHEGKTPQEATIQAMKDISGPVIAIALILAAVFVPVSFVPGIVGRLYQQFAITIAVSVLISAFVALSLTPALCAMLLRKTHFDKDSRGLNQFFYRFNTWFARVTASYSDGVKYCIKKAPLVVVILICIFVATIGMFKVKPTGFIPTEDEGRLIITFELPEAASTTRSLVILEEMMKVAKANPAVAHYAALGGLNAITFAAKSNSGTMFCQLKPWKDRKSKDLQLEAIIGQFQAGFSKIKGANIIVIPPPPIPGMGNSSGFSFMIQQKQSNDDIKAFEKVVRTFVAETNKRPEIARAFSFFSASAPGYKINVDRAKCELAGVSTAEVFGTIQTYMGSRYINDFSIYGRNFRVMAQADTTYRKDMASLSKYYVRNVSGQMIPLNTLVTYQLIESAPVVSHYDMFRSAEINGTPKPGYSSGQAIQALKEVAAQVLPEGYGYDFSNLSREEIKSGNSAAYIFALSVLFVFLFLAALYESWSVPFSVMLAVPLGAFGAILTLIFLPKLSNNVYAQIGLITLIGLAAKNAILIVEFAKERVDRGMEIIAATIEAVQLRLRPILMTSLAFILGVLPLVLASGAGAVSRQTIGWTVLGGMLAATGLAVFIVPVLFVLITRLAYGKKLNTKVEPTEEGPLKTH
ncbi:MAG: acrD [Chitinophagaceae bacterium]|nr:acrD [Chitinophagaceae bacterium]